MSETGSVSASAMVPAAAAQCVVEAINSAFGEEPLGALLLELMRQPGRVLAQSGGARWPEIMLTVCDALGESSSQAVVVASALEFTIAATDVVDDLIDDDWDTELASSARALNASLAMTFLAQRLLAQLDHPRAAQLSSCLADGVLAACTGEDFDILFEEVANVSEQQALTMTERKAGSLVAMACQLGALVTTDDPNLVARLASFGRTIGIVVQLLNDLAAIDPSAPECGSDLRRRKKTLPIAYALRSGGRVARRSGLGRGRGLMHRAAIADAPPQLGRMAFHLGGR